MNVQAVEHLFEEELLSELKEVSIFKEAEEGELLIDFGQKITHIPIVLNGIIKVSREDQNGQEILLYYLKSSDTCSATLNCCTTFHQSEVRAMAEEQAQLLFIPATKMEEWLIKYHSWRRFVLNNFNARFEEMLEAVDSLAFQNMEERIITYLETKKNLLQTTNLQLTHEKIAQDLNSSRVVVSRILKKLEQNNMIKQARNKIQILTWHE